MEKSIDEKKNVESVDEQNNQLSDDSEQIYERTPMYVTKHSSRYQRQDLIRTIENKTGRTLLCFIAGNQCRINRDDVVGFVELLYKVSSTEKIDLMIHTLGGEIDAAEKIVKMLQAKIGFSEDSAKLQNGEELPFRVIVPDYAKSAGTLIALGANSIVMSDSSELGTIDPQVQLRDSFGNISMFSVFDYINAYEEFEQRLYDNPDSSPDRIMFARFEPYRLYQIRAIKERMRVCAEATVKRQGGPFTRIVTDLMDTKLFKSHSQAIDWIDAQKIGLNIEYLPFRNPLWMDYWTLYCLICKAINTDQRIFESRFVSYIPER